jgi:hypothetical protein
MQAIWHAMGSQKKKYVIQAKYVIKRGYISLRFSPYEAYLLCFGLQPKFPGKCSQESAFSFPQVQLHGMLPGDRSPVISLPAL